MLKGGDHLTSYCYKRVTPNTKTKFIHIAPPDSSAMGSRTKNANPSLTLGTRDKKAPIMSNF